MWALYGPQAIQPPLHFFLTYRCPCIGGKSSNTTLLSRSSKPQVTAFAAGGGCAVVKGTTNYNHLIQSLCKLGDIKQALEVLRRGECNPTQRTYEYLIRCCEHRKSLPDGVSVHQHLKEDINFDQDPFLATKLIDMYSAMSCVEYALQVFDELPNRTIYVWNAILRALALASRGTEVLNFFREMRAQGVAPDRFTYTYVLKACVVAEEDPSILLLGKGVHAQVLRRGFESNVNIMTTLLDFYSRLGWVSYASHVFCNMSTKNVVSWSAMIACYVKNEKPLEAMSLFYEMIRETSDSSPNPVTMVSVLQACSALSALLHGKIVHAYILRRGLDTILPVKSALMMLYARCGNLQLALRIFGNMNKRDVVSWNSLISSYGINGFGPEAVEAFQRMLARGVKPNAITFVSVLGACSHSGLVDVGKSLFRSMIVVHRISPCVEHYACMVDLLGRANQLDEAAKIIDEMKLKPGPSVWGSLLGSCRIHCNVELAQKASSELFELEPRNAGNYVLLADIYAEAEMWEEVKRVKKLIEARGLRKVSGCSRIEVRRKVYSFMAVDELNPHIEQVHALLINLAKEMKDRGYIPKTNVVLYELDEKEKEDILLGHSEKLAVAFGLINTSRGETIRITKNLRLCEDCHSVTKFISEFAHRDIIVRDVNRIHHFHDGVCSCGDYW